MPSNHETPNAEMFEPNTVAGVGSTVLAPETLHSSVIEEHMPGVEGVAKEALPVLDGKATLIVGAEVTDPWHYSSGTIEEFTKDGLYGSRKTIRRVGGAA